MRRVPDVFDYEDALEQGEFHHDQRLPRCNRCGSLDVRWRQQSGRWVLFSLTPGIEHVCEISTEGFGPVKERD